MGIGWRDNGLTYGKITRLLHWSMAAIFAWQFLGMGLKLALGRTPIVSFFVGTHASLGLVLMFLAVLRAIWGLLNLRNRPMQEAGLIGTAAHLGHLALYALILCVPLLAILRAYGSQRGAGFFGVPVIPGAPEKVEWMVTLGNSAHGLLAWTLLALVAGHIGMVVVHRHVWKDDVLAKMAGRPIAAAE